MKLQRRFYDSSINFKNISRERLILAVVFGLASAFTIYSFFYVLRETFRVMSFGLMNYGFQNTQNILKESDRNFYNLFFAGLSLILGNSITILFVFSKPDKIINRFNSKRKRLLNDQIFLSFNFVYWFNKIGLAFGVFSMCCMDFDFIPYFKPLVFLLLLVLYLESWKSLSFVFKKNRFKIQFFHLLLILTLSFGLSRIDIIDYKSIDKLSLKYNPIIDLPRSDFYNYKNNRRYLDIAFKLKLDKNNNLEIFTEDKRSIRLDEVAYYITGERASRREELIPFIRVRILADKGINLKYIKMLEAEFYVINQLNIVYDVYNEDLMALRFENGAIEKRITKSVLDYKANIKLNEGILIPPGLPVDSEASVFNDTLTISVLKEIKIEGLAVSKKKLIKEFKKRINQKTLFLYSFNEDTKYQDYITVLASHFTAVSELREQEQTIFGEDDKHYRDEQYRLKEKYPIIIMEKLD